MGHALRRYQERFEPTVTRILLAGIFVTGLTAQFVKPVGDALLSLVGPGVLRPQGLSHGPLRLVQGKGG
ncbi:hypothetical protein ABZ725_18515 [Streptomyces sp. NPDC006872]|uniref:hypothetical protein n=1 Tax=Streptomyces sp. NPDC006872 TaxID=3155720 RepID=UPI0033EE91EC